jgi:hypothetical protein
MMMMNSKLSPKAISLHPSKAARITSVRVKATLTTSMKVRQIPSQLKLNQKQRARVH